MSPAPQTPSDSEHAREKAEQEKIAAQIVSDAPVKSDPQVAGTPAEAPEPQPTVKLRPVADAVEHFPLSVSVVGPEDELVFDSADSTVDVPPHVAEQVTYLPNVEVVA